MTVVAVLGCGLIGSSWIRVFRECGATIKAWDPNPLYAGSLDDERVEVSGSPQAAVAGADFIQESGPEDLVEKRRLYAEIAECLEPSAIVASSTSTFQPTDLQRGLPFAERVIVGHPFNPPHVLPLVEVVGGRETSPDVVDRAMEYYRAFGRYPIRLRTERLGHLVNRIQAAVLRESIEAVASGQATVEDVDAAMTLSLGPRWALLGPFSTFHVAGGDGGLNRFFDVLGHQFEAIWDDANRPVLTQDLKLKLAEAAGGLLAGRTENFPKERNDALHAIISASQQTSWSVASRGRHYGSEKLPEGAAPLSPEESS